MPRRRRQVVVIRPERGATPVVSVVAGSVAVDIALVSREEAGAFHTLRAAAAFFAFVAIAGGFGSNMNQIVIFALALAGVAMAMGGWFGWQLLRQNGRILLRLDDIEERLHALEFGEAEDLATGSSAEEAKANRFGHRSLARSKINRSGLKAGERAPKFR